MMKGKKAGRGLVQVMRSCLRHYGQGRPSIQITDPTPSFDVLCTSLPPTSATHAHAHSLNSTLLKAPLPDHHFLCF